MSEAERTTEGKPDVEYLDSPDKSEYDKAEYRVIRLQNGLTALLISDLGGAHYDDMSCKDYEEGSSSTKRVKRDVWKAFCGLCVGVGSFSDPPEVPGLAHFLQRVVFMGSKKYPKENDFNEFISLHGGTTNGATDCEHTRFYFDISEKHLFAALDRFVQFFIEPLMKKDVIAREREIIQGEFQWGLYCDKNRKEQILSFIARTGHPSSKFLRRTSIALHNDIDDDKLYEELHKFRERHYSAHRMMLAIQARLPLDTLKTYVITCFGNILSNWLPSDNFTEFREGISFDTVAFKKMYKVKPVKDISQLHVTWALPSILNLYRSKPYKYISLIIEHKGNGSLTHYLRKKMWALNLFCGNCDNDNSFGYNSMYALFEIIVELTQEGLKHQQDILEAIFSFIKLVKRMGPQESIYNEIYKIRNDNFRAFFRYFSKHDVFDLCKNMHFYTSRDYITGKHNYFEYNPEAIQKCLDFLVPETANIIVFNNDFALNIVEPYFKINYTDIALQKDWKFIKPLTYFRLPSRNEFLTNNFSTIPISAETSKYPVKIHQDLISEIWCCPKFYWPMCYINLHIILPQMFLTSNTAILLDMYCTVLKYLLNEKLHSAVTAGFNYTINVSKETIGIIIQLSGFDEKLSTLLMIIANDMVHLGEFVSKDLFEIIKTHQLKTYYNKFLKPEEFIENVELWILKYPYYPHVHKYNYLNKLINFKNFQSYAMLFTNTLYFQCLVQGNVTKDFTIKIIQRFINKINCRPLRNTNKLEPIGITKIPQGTSYYKLKNINRTNVNSVVTNYYQVDIATIELSVLIQLMLMIIKEPLMNHLRTQEKLSYVSCNLKDINGMLGYSITVYTQTNKYPTEYIDLVIERFLNSFKIILEQFSEKKLDDIKEGLRILKQHDAEILKNEINRNWSEITKRQFMFDRCEKEALAIENLNINKLREWFGRHTLNGNNFRKLSIHVVGIDPKEIAVNAENRRHNEYFLTEFIIDDSQHKIVHITDINKYKNNRLVYPYNN
ncbi:PREDICTED: nardilysin-like [Atta colombica]|uniref:nardilysin-like n=1 Tax=Atta colombica TaxID=520822 RepID=UPI00084C561F|nr:PREDICTED: nardilysin-like [Atta colombica]